MRLTEAYWYDEDLPDGDGADGEDPQPSRHDFCIVSQDRLSEGRAVIKKGGCLHAFHNVCWARNMIALEDTEYETALTRPDCRRRMDDEEPPRCF